MSFKSRLFLTSAAFLCCLSVASAQLEGPPEKLDKLAASADIIFKGAAVSSATVQDSSFQKRFGFQVCDTRFSIISMIKGNKPGDTLEFRHYDSNPAEGSMEAPQYYHFEIGRTYIVFAKKSGATAHFTQAWMYPSTMPDRGSLLCIDKRPVAASSVKDAYWNELTALLKSTNPEDVEYAIHHLDQMGVSQDEFQSAQDFDRKQSLAAIIGLADNSNPKIAACAINAIGCGNPFLNNDSAPFWLASVGSGNLPGLGTLDPGRKNPGGELYWKNLVLIASNQQRVPSVRAGAIRALGLVKAPALEAAIVGWLGDPAPAVRASATLLLAGFPGPGADKSWAGLANDTSPEVRAAAALAIGFAQQPTVAPLLDQLLKDKEAAVRKAAAMSLLSFSPKNEAFAKIFRDNLANQEFHPLFLNALARNNPSPYLDALAQSIIEGHQPGYMEPANWWGGLIPAFDSWKILIKYLRAQPVQIVRSGKLDHYLDALEKVGNYSSEEPCEIYAFYLARGLTDRAKIYRAYVTKTSTFDMTQFLQRVAQNPSEYDQD